MVQRDGIQDRWMNWKIGQKLVCDRPDTSLTGCTIRAADADGVIIFCPEVNLVVCGKQENLEQQGWQLDQTHQSDESGPG